MTTLVYSAGPGLVPPEPPLPINTSWDARLHGLEDLRSAKHRVRSASLVQYLNSGPEARTALLQLGKIAFWDEQIGSGGHGGAGEPSQACASCHFHAGADSRTRNQVNPNLTRVSDRNAGPITGLHHARPNPDETFQTRQPNEYLKPDDFPFIRVIDRIGHPENSNDVGSSQGVLRSQFRGTTAGQAEDNCEPWIDPVFKTAAGVKVRRVEPRNTPTVYNASLTSFFGFWDGRANPFFNGQNPFGVQDPRATVLVVHPDDLGDHSPDIVRVIKKQLRIPFSSLASQATGPVLSDFEMSCGVPEAPFFNARSWPEVGKKLFRRSNTGQHLVPLAGQYVSLADSVLGSIANGNSEPGVNTNYESLVQTAFQERYWNAPGNRIQFIEATVDVPGASHPVVTLVPQVVPVGPDDGLDEGRNANPVDDIPVSEAPSIQHFRLIEANAALFIGIAIQEYERTLITDDTWFDRWLRTGEFNNGFGNAELRGLNVFVDDGKCINCHGGPELTNASVRNAQAYSDGRATNIIEPMLMGNNDFAIYDNGFYNIGVTPTFEDIGRGGKGPTGAPLSSSRQRLFKENNLGDIPFEIIGGQFVPAHTEDESEPVCEDENRNTRCDLDEPLLPSFQRVAVDGAFKTPGLRTVNLTGPYFHNGSAATLRQVVEFYDNGGNFCKTNKNNLDPDIESLGLSEQQKQDLVSFMLSLDDPRVAQEQAPFDHPSLTIASDGAEFGTTRTLPAVGRQGRIQQFLAPIEPFLGVNQQDPGRAPLDACSP